MTVFERLENEYQEAIRYGTIIFRLDNKQTNSRLDIIDYNNKIQYWHLLNGKITDLDVIGNESTVGHVVTFDRNGKFGRDYIQP